MAPKQGTIRSFDRYELKYVVHVSQLPALANDLSLNMALDAHGDGTGSYDITNLYYDSAELHLLHSKIVGTSYRRKLRVRVYGETPGDPAGSAMVEIKQRLRRTTQKRRVVLPLPEAYRLCQGELPRRFEDPVDLNVAEEMTAMVHGLQLRPACVIAYRRRAFVGSRFEPGLRVTMDTDLWCAPPSLDLPRPSLPMYVMPRDWAILEIKVDERVPNWVCELVANHDCQLRRVSKYCLGMVRLLALQSPLNPWSTGESSPVIPRARASQPPGLSQEPIHELRADNTV
jgi:SPX domain protein involved in polyphosphate accumulation